MTLDSSTTYWDGVGAEWAGARDALWRRHSDAVNAALVRRWLPAAARRVLKTDLFDEAVSGGPLVGRASEPAAAAHPPTPGLYGIDVSPRIAAAARAAAGTRICVSAGDVRALPYAADTFDAAVSLSTLDHFASTGDIDMALRELRRVLRPGGTLILTLDNPMNPAVGLRNAVPSDWLVRAGLTPYQTGRTLGPRRLAARVIAAGFSVRERTAILHVPRLPAVRLCRRAQRSGSTVAQARLLRTLVAFECLATLPFRFLTGHFTALLAEAAGG